MDASIVDLPKREDLPEIKPGDTVKVWMKVVEGERERLQAFEGIVLRVRRGGAGANFTVRRVFHGVGVERTFPTHSPRLEKVEITRHGNVRRAKLYYLRGLSSRKARLKVKARRRDEVR